LVSLVATGILVGLIVKREGAGREVALFGSLLYVAEIAILMPSRLGMNDPQLLGEALSTAGFYFYIKSKGNDPWLVLSALTFCVAGFTKQNLIAFPAAVGLDLLVRSRKSLAMWTGAMVAFAMMLTVTTVLVDGHHFLAHLTLHRAYSLRHAWHHNIHVYLLTVQSIILVGIIWLICTSRPRLLFAATFLMSHLIAFSLAGGDGVDLNICFNALAAIVIICGISLADIESASLKPPNTLSGPKLSGALMLAIALVLMIHVPERIREARESMGALRSQENEFKLAVQFLRSRPGPALCESLLLCYEASKAKEFDPFWVADGLKTERLDEAKILQLLKSRHFQSVQIKLSGAEGRNTTKTLLQERSHSDDFILPSGQTLFFGTFMQKLLQEYGVVYRDSQILIFAPCSSMKASHSRESCASNDVGKQSDH
jgi:hypothetical protein